MSETLKFGRKSAEYPTFEIDDYQFSAMPLSLAEEKALAKATNAQGTDENAMMDGLVEEIAKVLDVRTKDPSHTIEASWLLQALSPKDLQAIMALLRGDS